MLTMSFFDLRYNASDAVTGLYLVWFYCVTHATEDKSGAMTGTRTGTKQ